MTVFVMSATGTTGRATVAALRRRGASVRAGSRRPSAARVAGGAEPVEFDLLDPSSWAGALAGAGAVYLCVPAALSDETAAPRAFVDYAVSRGVHRVVTLSGWRGDTRSSPQGQWESAVEQSGASWIHLRPNFFAENFFDSVVGDAIALPAGEGRTSFVSASDIGEAAAEALLGDREGEVWTLTGPEALSHGQVAAILSDVLSRPVQYRDVSASEFTAALVEHGGVPEEQAAFLSGVYAGEVARDVYARVADDFERAVGRPATSFRNWAQAHSTQFSAR